MGHIYSYRATLWGKIHEEDVPEFDLAEIEKAVTEKLDSLTEEARKAYDRVEYRNFSYRVSMISETEYIIICIANIDCIYVTDKADIPIGERIIFAVLL